MKGSQPTQQPVVVRYPRRNILAVALLLLVTGLAFVALFNLVSLNSTDSQTSSYVTVTGAPTCLPNKNTGGPTTLECALGLKGDDGRYYALIDAPMSLLQEDFDARVKVRGTLTEPASNSQYNISGTLAVESVTKQ